jgi:superfamily II DNA or RNA helicase
MPRFITNHPDRDLSTRLRFLSGAAQQLDLLTGFFAFSAWPELYQPLKEAHEKGQTPKMRLLVGMGVLQASDPTNRALKEAFLKLLEEGLQDPALDHRPDLPEQARFFLQLFLEGHLELRKTKEPNHAKLYLFHLQPQHQGLFNRPGVFITGSSNLTHAGLKGQHEFNVEIMDYGFPEALDYFEALWKEATPLTREDWIRERLTRAVERGSLAALPTPFEAYALLVKRYVDGLRGSLEGFSLAAFLEEIGYKAYRYQTDAVETLRATLEAYGGAILADVVGLGKSVVASALGRAVRERGIVIAPPALLGREDYGWEYYLEAFGLRDWRAFSSGKLDEALAYLQRFGQDVGLVVVDEAHRFRNPETEAYAQLRAITAGRKTLLLTATPYNNRPRDIYALLSLFITPGESALPPYRNLHAQFMGSKYGKGLDQKFLELSYILRYARSPRPSEAAIAARQSRYSKARKRAERLYRAYFEEDSPILEGKVRQAMAQIAQTVRTVMAPVTLRRNRLDLLKDPRYRGEAPDFPTVRDPVPLFFELEAEQEAFYDRVIAEWFGSEGVFSAALYRPEWYRQQVEEDEDPGGDLPVATLFTLESQGNLAEHMRRLLVRRFESSFYAFTETLRRMTERYRMALEVAEQQGIFYLNKDLLEQAASGELLLDPEELPEEEAYRKEAFSDEAWARFMKALADDLKLLEGVSRQADALRLADPQTDPKARRFTAFLKESLQREPSRKIVVFTEFADTALALYQHLHAEGLRVYWPGRSPGAYEIETIVHNFDASLIARNLPHMNHYDVLVVTDKFSEGINLNRAGHVVNYDIPWNPVRLIQRIGRVNRVGAVLFKEVGVYHFFPSAKGQGVVDPAKVAAEKLFLIHKALGEDSKVLSENEEPSPALLYQRLTQNPEEEVSFDTWILEEWEALKRQAPDIEERIQHLPNRVKTARALRADERPRVLAVAQKARAFFGIQSVGERLEPVAFAEALEAFKATPEEPRLELSEAFWPTYRKLEEGLQEERAAWPTNSSEQRLLNVINTLVSQKTLPEEDLQLLNQIKKDLLGPRRLPRAFIRQALAATPEPLTHDANLDRLRKVLEKGKRWYGGLLEEAPRPEPVALVVSLEVRPPI